MTEHPEKNRPKSATQTKSLTRGAILDAAVALADERGIDALSMRKLAETLSIEAMSLYNHVKNKDDLLDGMVDAVVAEIELPATNIKWKAAMRQRAISTHTMLLRHPWASVLIVSRINIGSAMLRYGDAALGCLHAAGFPYALADHAINAIDSHIYGFTLLKSNFPIEEKEYTQAAEQFLPMIPASTYPHAHALAEEVISGQHSGINEFTFGLDLILDGLERLAN